MTNKVSLTQFIIEQQRGLPDASGTFSYVTEQYCDRLQRNIAPG